MKSSNRHKVELVKDKLKPDQLRHDWRQNEDGFYQSLRGADERLYVLSTKNKDMMIFATSPTRRLFRNFKYPFNPSLERSGFNVTLDPPQPEYKDQGIFKSKSLLKEREEQNDYFAEHFTNVYSRGRNF